MPLIKYFHIILLPKYLRRKTEIKEMAADGNE